MPKTKAQGIVFGILMSFFMAYGMEVYNISIRMGFNLTEGLGFASISYGVFAEALKEAALMAVIVFAVSNLIGNRAGARFMERHCNAETDNPYFCRIMRQAGIILLAPRLLVSGDEPHSVAHFSDHIGRRADPETSGDMGRNGAEELPHGVFLEYVRSSTARSSDI